MQNKQYFAVQYSKTILKASGHHTLPNI